MYEPKGTMYKDQMGKSSHRLIRGNRYQMILHEIYGNSTWIKPMKKKTEGEMILAQSRSLGQMKAQGIIPTHQVLENGISMAYILEIKNTSMNYQLIPLDDKQHNLAEKAIQMWKDHFIGVMSGTAENFPTHLWCQSIPQAERQLLLLQKSNVNPKISTYAHVYGPYNYNAAPFVPICMETLVKDKTKRRGTFAEHCSKGFVLGTAFEHYGSWIMVMKDTRATRILSTVFHKNKYINNKDITPKDRVIPESGNLADTLKCCMPPHLSKKILEKLEHIGTILKHEQKQTVQPNTPMLPHNPPPPPHRTHPAYIPV